MKMIFLVDGDNHLAEGLKGLDLLSSLYCPDRRKYQTILPFLFSTDNLQVYEYTMKDRLSP